jgi:PhnB protein
VAETLPWARHGRGTVRPYLYGDLSVIDFIERVLGAELLEKLENKGASPGFHIEARVGDSMLVLEASDAWAKPPPVQSVYVYVPDVDAAYARAMALGATSIAAPEQKPYKERAGGVKDRFGNTWYISTYTG